jgi:uncharacterized protein YsxB (DUF464 family)
MPYMICRLMMRRLVFTSNISDTTQVLLDALELGLRTMAADNPDYLLITVKEV